MQRKSKLLMGLQVAILMTAVALPVQASLNVNTTTSRTSSSSVVSLRSYVYRVNPVPAPTPAPVPTPTPAPVPAPTTNATSSAIPIITALTADEQKMVNMINQERIAAGVSPLKVDLRLASVGRTKANDMKTNNYFSHTSPTYGSPWAMMKLAGLPVGWAGENIGKTQSVESAMAGFMNSPGHKANILDPRFTHVGIGIAGNLFVQEFMQIK